MQKEPTFFFIVRVLCLLGILFFMAMLYWSSLIIEGDVRGMKQTIEKLSVKVNTAPQVVERPKVKPQTKLISSEKNLLKEDQFYTKTLPDVLLPKDFVPSGTRHGDGIGKPDTLHPFTNLLPYAQYIRQCQLNLSTLQFGKYETMAPSLAVSIEENGNEFLVKLRQGVYWAPLDPLFFSSNFELAPIFLQKHEVTAHDVKFYFDAVMNPFVQEPAAVAVRNYLNEIESMDVVDDYTLVVRWKMQDGKVKYAARSLTGELTVLPSFVYKYFADGKKIIEDDEDPETYRNNSVWAEQFSKHWAKNIIVSCGPWLFDGMSDTQIRFKRNPDHFNPYEILVDAMQINFKDTSEAIWQDFKTGAIDNTILDSSKLLEYKDFQASKEYKKQEEKGLAIKTLEYVYGAFFFIGWNQKTPYFSSAKTRVAMTMAIDRDRIIAQNLNGMGVPITGTFALDSPAYDPTIQPWPFDPAAAERLLEEEGWVDTDGDGIRDKLIDGKRVPFQFTLNYYVKNQSAKINCESIRTFLKEVGVDCRPNGVDVADLSNNFENKDFEAIFYGWSQGSPPEDPKQLWHSSGAKEKGSSNAIGFDNKEADSIIDKLLYEYDKDKRIQLYHQFNKILHEEQPYTFLYSPKVLLLYRDYVKNVFIPKDRQDLIPGANIDQPELSVIWLESIGK